MNFDFGSSACAWARSGTANGAAPNVAIKLLRFKSVIRIPFFRLKSSGFPSAHKSLRGEYHTERLGLRLVVADIVDRAQHHHRVVFVDHVVAVQRESSDEVAETKIDRCLHVVL